MGYIRRYRQRRSVETALSGLENLNAETLELVAMAVIDGAQPRLYQPISKPLLHDPGEW